MEKLVWFVFMVAISVVAVAQAAPPSDDCNSVLMDMFDCLSFVENGSTVPGPSTSCCNGFKKVLRNSPQCICEAFYNQNGSGLPIPIDMKKAMSLSAACKATGPIPCIVPGANGPSPAPSPSRSIPTPAPKKSPPSHSPAPETMPAPSPSTSEDVNAPAPVRERSTASVLSIPSSVALILAVLALVGSSL